MDLLVKGGAAEPAVTEALRRAFPELSVATKSIEEMLAGVVLGVEEVIVQEVRCGGNPCAVYVDAGEHVDGEKLKAALTAAGFTVS